MLQDLIILQFRCCMLPWHAWAGIITFNMVLKAVQDDKLRGSRMQKIRTKRSPIILSIANTARVTRHTIQAFTADAGAQWTPGKHELPGEESLLGARLAETCMPAVCSCAIITKQTGASKGCAMQSARCQ